MSFLRHNLADLRVEDVGDLLMVAISVSRQQYLARHSKLTCLGIVTPAFSQAWIKAEPAVIVSEHHYFLIILQVAYPLSKPFFHLSY